MDFWTSRPVSVVIVSLLAISVFCEVCLFPAMIRRVGEVFPEVLPVQVPALIWGVMVISCWQAMLVLLLVALRMDRRVAKQPRGLVAWIVGLLLAILLLSIVALVTLGQLGFGTPGVMLALILMGVLALVGTVSTIIVSNAR